MNFESNQHASGKHDDAKSVIRKARGRKDRGNQEKVIELAHLEDKIETLTELYAAHQDMGVTLNDGIKAAAEESGLLASVVKKYIVARAGNNFEEKAKEAHQMSLVFEELANA